MASFWDYLAPIAGAFAGGATGLPFGSVIGAAAGSGLQTGLSTGQPLAGLAAAAGSGAGAFLGGKLLSPSLNTASGGVGNQMNTGIQSSLGDSGLGGMTDFGDQTYGDVLGTAAGGLVGGQLGASMVPPRPTSNDPVPYIPSQQAAMTSPGSLSQYSGLSPDQQLSGIATKGVYGGGNSPDENKYFLNLVNHDLVDPTGKVGNMSQLNPVENSYLGQLGLGGYGSTTDLLKGISNYAG